MGVQSKSPKAPLMAPTDEWLTFSFTSSAEGLQGSINYSTDLFREETVRRMANHLRVLVEAAVVGRSFDFDTVREASGRGEEETLASLEELASRGLIREVADDILGLTDQELLALPRPPCRRCGQAGPSVARTLPGVYGPSADDLLLLRLTSAND